jgi:hypothetical protein
MNSASVYGIARKYAVGKRKKYQRLRPASESSAVSCQTIACMK